MKKILLLAFLTLVIASCGKSKEESMFSDFKALEIKDALKTTPEELNFNIESIEKVKDIKASDSIIYLHNKLLETYKATDEENKKLTFDYAIKQIDTIISSTQELILLRIKGGRDYENYESKNQRDEYIEKKVYLESWKMQTDRYSKNKDEVLSTEYKVMYTIDNPILKIKQNFTSQIYSNKENTKIIREIKND